MLRMIINNKNVFWKNYLQLKNFAIFLNNFITFNTPQNTALHHDLYVIKI